MLIPDKEAENILSVYWQMLSVIEGHTDPKKDILDKFLVEGAYNVLNRIKFSPARPRWENEKVVEEMEDITEESTPVAHVDSELL